MVVYLNESRITKKSTMKIYLLIVTGSLSISCAIIKQPTSVITKGTTLVSKKDIDIDQASEVPTGLKPEQNIKIIAQIGEIKDGDPIKIKGVQCEGNNLLITVSYVGGCGEHSFEVNGSRTIMKSSPKKRTIKLTHTNHKDYCKSIIEKTIEVDIKELSDIKKDGSKIFLLLDGWDETIEYIFE